MTKKAIVLVSAMDSDGSIVTRSMNIGEKMQKNGQQIRMLFIGQWKAGFEVSSSRTKTRGKQLRRLCKQSRPLKYSATQSQEEFEDDELDPAELDN
jgi:hypothetical protein